jgi:hypothetical protein
VTKEFSPDHEDSALRRLSTAIDQPCKSVQTSLTLDDESSPLFRMRRKMLEVMGGMATSNTQFQSEVRATLEGFKARREEAARSTRHGTTFESAVGDFLHHEAQRLGDRAAPAPLRGPAYHAVPPPSGGDVSDAP